MALLNIVIQSGICVEKRQITFEIQNLDYSTLEVHDLEFEVRKTGRGKKLPLWKWTQKISGADAQITKWPINPGNETELQTFNISPSKTQYPYKFGRDPMQGSYELTAIYKRGKNIGGSLKFNVEPASEQLTANKLDELKNQFPDPGQTSPVALQRTTEESTSDLVLWGIIKRQKDIFNNINKNVADQLCSEDDNTFNDVKAYDKLKNLMDSEMKQQLRTTWDVDEILRKLKAMKDTLGDYPKAKYQGLINSFILNEEYGPGWDSKWKGKSPTFPYHDRVKNVNDMPESNADNCKGIIEQRIKKPMLLELAWSYWHEECMMVQAMKTIGNRFQNKKNVSGNDPLINLNTNPLRRLGNLLWGYIQDEQNRLSVKRRAYEYDHHYGITLHGKAVQQMMPADSRTTFIEALHRLLYLCSIYFKELDDVTIYADAFPIKNALRDVHVILAEGAHNQYGDLVWVARREMYTEQFILARPEMREFLSGRPMVPYRESWMQPIDTMKKLMGWTDSSVEHFSTLANTGEQILLTVRFGDWNSPNIKAAHAANWVGYWRDEIQDYLHSYRAVTGVDLTDARQVDGTQPSVHLLRRLTEQQRKAG
jgi:hypothetical protein